MSWSCLTAERNCREPRLVGFGWVRPAGVVVCMVGAALAGVKSIYRFYLAERAAASRLGWLVLRGLGFSISLRPGQFRCLAVGGSSLWLVEVVNRRIRLKTLFELFWQHEAVRARWQHGKNPDSVWVF